MGTQETGRAQTARRAAQRAISRAALRPRPRETDRTQWRASEVQKQTIHSQAFGAIWSKKTNKTKADKPEWAHKNRQSADHAAAVWRESHSRPCDRPRSRQYNERRSGRAPERRTASYGSRRRPYCRPATAGEDTLRRQNALCRFFFEKSCKRAEKPLDIREKKAIIMFECCGIV